MQNIILKKLDINTVEWILNVYKENKDINELINLLTKLDLEFDHNLLSKHLYWKCWETKAWWIILWKLEAAKEYLNNKYLVPAWDEWNWFTLLRQTVFAGNESLKELNLPINNNLWNDNYYFNELPKKYIKIFEKLPLDFCPKLESYLFKDNVFENLKEGNIKSNWPVYINNKQNIFVPDVSYLNEIILPLNLRHWSNTIFNKFHLKKAWSSAWLEWWNWIYLSNKKSVAEYYANWATWKHEQDNLIDLIKRRKEQIEQNKNDKERVKVLQWLLIEHEEKLKNCKIKGENIWLKCLCPGNLKILNCSYSNKVFINTLKELWILSFIPPKYDDLHLGDIMDYEESWLSQSNWKYNEQDYKVFENIRNKIILFYNN